MANLWEALAVFVAAASVLVTGWFSHRELKRSRAATGVDILLRQRQHFFHEPSMLRVRREAAAAILKLIVEPDLNWQEDNLASIDDLLNFFDMTGYLVDNEIIDPSATGQVFGYWLTRYWQPLSEYIGWSRLGKDPTLWSSAKDWYESLERKRTITTEALSEFLRDEMALEA